MFIMLDGIDGSGKSTIINAWKKYLTDEGNAVFDLRKYWLDTGEYPELSEMKAYEFIFSCEPTYTGIGKVIRTELINKDRNYSARAIAEAYSLDRLVLYEKIIIPLLRDKKCVIQDRGVCSSLAYQPLQSPELSQAVLCNLPGNKLALTHCPNHLILMKIEAKNAMERLAGRNDKHDNVIYEKLAFQSKLARVYESDEFKKCFTNRGTKINYLNAELGIDIMKQEAIKLLTNILN